jgi:DHA1 family tetracycline resistance protein-like MFS transporter
MQRLAVPQPGRAAFAFIFVTVVLDMLALGIIVPVLPMLVKAFEGGDTARAADAVGVFGTAWALMQFLFSPLLGALSDRFGRRPVVLLSNFGLALDYVVMALAPSLAWLFVGRVISGITAASISTAGAYIADVTPPERRAQRFGMLGAAFGFGFVVGPALGGLLGAIDLRLPFWAAAGLSIANFAYGFFILPESLPPASRAAFDWRKANPVGALKLLASHPALLGLAAAAFLSRIAHDSLPSTFVLYADHRYGWDERMVGFVLTGVGVCSMIVQAGLTGPIVARFGERRALLVAFVCGIASFLIYGLAASGALFIAGIPIGALYGLSFATMQGLMTARVDATEQGQLQGALSSLAGIGAMIAPLLFTQSLAAAVAHSGLPEGLPYLIAAAILATALAIAWRATRPAIARH